MLYVSVFYFPIYRKIHVTKQTLDLLDDQYIYEAGTDKARDDPFLIKNNIETFLISPQYFSNPNVRGEYFKKKTNRTLHLFLFLFFQYQYSISDDVNRRYSSGIRKHIGRTSRVPVSEPKCLCSSDFIPRILFFPISYQRNRNAEPRPTLGRSFMQNSMQQYMKIMKQTNIEMARELDRMPIGKFQ